MSAHFHHFLLPFVRYGLCHSFLSETVPCRSLSVRAARSEGSEPREGLERRAERQWEGSGSILSLRSWLLPLPSLHYQYYLSLPFPSPTVHGTKRERSEQSEVNRSHSLTVPTVGHPGSVHYKKIKYYLRLVRARRRIPQGEPSDRGVTVRSGSTSSSINKLYDLTGFISYLYDITVILLFVSYYLYFFYFCFSVSRDYWKEIKEAEIQIIRIW